MLVAALVLGLLASVQWPASAGTPSGGTDRVERAMHQLELEQAELKRAVGRLREELNARQRETAAGTDLLRDLRAELTRQKMRAGLLDVRGPGVRVVLDDAHRAAADGREAANLLVHDYDVRDVVNLLWLAGAEAVAVNEERIVNHSSIYCVGSTIMVNDTRLSPPYRIGAIGDQARLLDYLRNPGYLTDLKSRSKRFGLRVEFLRADTMLLPAYQGSFPLRFAQPGGKE